MLFFLGETTIAEAWYDLQFLHDDSFDICFKSIRISSKPGGKHGLDHFKRFTNCSKCMNIGEQVVAERTKVRVLTYI